MARVRALHLRPGSDRQGQPRVSGAGSRPVFRGDGTHAACEPAGARRCERTAGRADRGRPQCRVVGELLNWRRGGAFLIDVLGFDIAGNLVETGNKRASEAGLTNCKFRLGDACDLHELKDNSFDLVVSIFGAMFAPEPFDVAKEMVRVTRSGGRIGMGNWIPNDPTLVAQILKISSAYSPPPPEGFVSPMTWGIESNVLERFGGAGA